MGGFRFRSVLGAWAQKCDPAIEEIATAIAENLRGLSLAVDCRRYGPGFIEIKASTSPRFVTTPGDPVESGVALLLAGKFEPPALVLEQINAARRGLGRKMATAALSPLRARPGVLTRVKVNDLSPFQCDGRRWWAHVADDWPDLDWRITSDPDATHWSRHWSSATAQIGKVPPPPEEITRKRALLAALARDFGHDPACVTLSLETRTFDFLGQQFKSEGEASPGGRVTIYYDPSMTDARLGCCLAHELQHIRYFAVRDAYLAEPAQGPLQRRFEAFTPEILAAQRGVSNYSNEHWDAWRGIAPPRLFSDELAEGGSEPINETIADVAKALYNFGRQVAINPVWRALQRAVDEEYFRLNP